MSRDGAVCVPNGIQDIIDSIPRRVYGETEAIALLTKLGYIIIPPEEDNT